MSVMNKGTLIELVSREHGLKAQSSWSEDIEVALEAMSRVRECSPETMGVRAISDAALRRELVGFLTINESYFFRQKEHFEFLDEHLQERLADTTFGRFTIWSAGCADGEEALSIAITIKDRFNELGKKRFHIVANDIDQFALRRAAQGRFAQWAFRDVPTRIIRRHFTELDGKYVIDRSLLEIVQFLHCSMFEMETFLLPASVDVAFFRNVAIYLNREATAEIYKIFERLLKEGALLFVAPSDPRPPDESFCPADDQSTTIFRRQTKRVRPKRVSYTHTPPEPARKISIPPPFVPSIDQVGMLGDRGDLEEALAAAEAVIEADTTCTQGYVLKGHLLLAVGRIEEAIADFRRALFLDGDGKVARYWYVISLMRGGHQDQAMVHLDELLRQLSGLHPELILNDGETTVEELLQEASSLRENGI